MPLLAVALVLLAESFGRDVWWSWSHRDGEAAGAETGAGPALLDGQSSDPPPSDPGPEPEDGPPAGRGPWRGRIRAVIAAVLTILSFLLVWAVLVAPDQPVFLKAGAFLRVPLEGLVVVLIAIFLPVTGRRILAVLTGLALALVVVLKVINYEIFSLFSRAFEPLGDIGQFGNALETLHLEQGDSQARLIEIGAVAGVVAAIVLLPLAMLRVTRVAADHRQRALRVIGALAGVWLVLGVLGTTLVSRTPIASTISAGVIFDTAKVVRAEVHDEGVFAKEIKHDTFRDTPTNQLLTALRGKDVLLVFDESFGRVAIEESSVAPEVNKALAEGDKRLASAGFHSRSGFLISSTFGGGSWLAHSSLQSGLWVHNLRRYAQLLPERRFTLASAFNRAGWRTVDEDVSNNRPWPEGKHVLPLGQNLQPQSGRLQRPHLLLRGDARPVHLLGVAASRAGENAPPAAVRGDRHGLQPPALEPHPGRNPLGQSRQRLDLQPPLQPLRT